MELPGFEDLLQSNHQLQRSAKQPAPAELGVRQQINGV